jgi:GTP-binding protein
MSVRKHLPLLAIVGRPNVGKSTLFNRLVGWRAALVDDTPGVTRDRIYGRTDWGGHHYAVVDTGGFEPIGGGDVFAAMRLQTEYAIAEADAVILVGEGRAGLHPADELVMELLRRQRKLVFVAVNKVDTARQEAGVADFYRLGVDRLYPVSAEHGRGVDELLDAIAAALPGADGAEEEDEATWRIALIGRPNTGKSTLLNRLLGEERHLVHPEPGTTRDAVDSEVMFQGRTYLFVDTAGIRRKSKVYAKLEKLSVVMALKSIERCHAAVMVVDALAGIAEQEARIAGLAHQRGRACLILLNKWDLVEDPEKRRVELDDEIQTKLKHVAYAPVLSIAAKTGLHCGRIMPALDQILEAYNRRVPTSELNRVLEKILAHNPPPSPGGKAIKINYLTQTAVRPPTFTFFVNRPQAIHFSYERYLQNSLREAFAFTGTPVRVLFRSKRK